MLLRLRSSHVSLAILLVASIAVAVISVDASSHAGESLGIIPLSTEAASLVFGGNITCYERHTPSSTVACPKIDPNCCDGDDECAAFSGEGTPERTGKTACGGTAFKLSYHYEVDPGDPESYYELDDTNFILCPGDTYKEQECSADTDDCTLVNGNWSDANCSLSESDDIPCQERGYTTLSLGC